MKPILFTIGQFHVFAFGFFLSLSFLLSTYIIWKYGKEELLEDELLDAYVYTSLVSLFISRLFYIFFHLNEFKGILSYIVFRQSPGLSFIGAILGVIIFLPYYCRKKKIDIRKAADIFTLSYCLGFSLASLGSFFGGAVSGKITNLPWGVSIVGLEGKRHPVELYQFFVLLLLFIFLTLVYNKFLKKNHNGLLTLIFIFLSSIMVLVLEFFKEGKVYLYGSINSDQVAAIAVGLISLAALSFYAVHTKKRKN